MDQARMNRILNKMARERYCSVEKVIEEFLKYQIGGEVNHFCPEDNTACMEYLKINNEKKYVEIKLVC